MKFSALAGAVTSLLAVVRDALQLAASNALTVVVTMFPSTMELAVTTILSPTMRLVAAGLTPAIVMVLVKLSLPFQAVTIPFRNPLLAFSFLALLFLVLYAPDEPMICKVSVFKAYEPIGICSTYSLSPTGRDADRTDRHRAEGWGVSRLAEMVGAAHGNITRAKYELLTHASEPTEFGNGLLVQIQSLFNASYAALLAIDTFVITVRDKLDFVLLLYYDFHTYTPSLSAKLNAETPHLSPDMAAELSETLNMGNATRDILHGLIYSLDLAYTDLCFEVTRRSRVNLLSSWWHGRSASGFTGVQLALADSLYDLTKAGTGLNLLLTELLLLSEGKDRAGVGKKAVFVRNVLKIIGTRLSSFLRLDGELDLGAKAGQDILDANEGQLLTLQVG